MVKSQHTRLLLNVLHKGENAMKCTTYMAFGCIDGNKGYVYGQCFGQKRWRAFECVQNICPTSHKVPTS